MHHLFFCLCAFLLPALAHATLLRVGPTREYPTIVDALAVAQDYDIILVDPGEYAGIGFETPLQGLTIQGVDWGRVVVAGVRTARAPGLTLAHLQLAQWGIVLESDDVTVVDIDCYSLVDYCVAAESPVARAIVRELYVYEGAGLYITGTGWTVEDNVICQQTRTFPYTILGSKHTLRRNWAGACATADLPGTPGPEVCYRVRASRVRMEGNMCWGGQQGIRVEGGSALTLDGSQLWETVQAIVLQRSPGPVLVRNTRLETHEREYGTCALTVARQAQGVTVQGNIWRHMARAYCGAGIGETVRRENLLRGITDPQAGETDVSEPLEAESGM